jgi:Arc/MetJ family transcription regulator
LYKKIIIIVQIYSNMLTNIDIDQKKIEEIMQIGKIKTKKEAVDRALDVLLRNLSAKELLKTKGSNVWEGDLGEMRTT